MAGNPLTGSARNLQARYNIAPTDTVDVVKRGDGGATELVSVRWGALSLLVEQVVETTAGDIHARAESVVDRPRFRDAFRRHRCIIPASGYYEWITKPDGKQPYFISEADGGA